MMGKKNETVSRSVKTAQNRTAAVMLLSGIAAFGLFVAALAGGFEGWAWIAAAAVIILLGGGVFLLRAGSRRREDPTVVYRPDGAQPAVEVDVNTGERIPHAE